MKRTGLCLILVCISAAAIASGRGMSGSTKPQKVILDTDMGNDVDDVLALDILFKYMDAGKIDLLAVMSSKDAEGSAPFIDIMNTFYGHAGIPIGVVRHGVSGEGAKGYDYQVWKMKDARGRPLFKTSVKDYLKLPDAHTLYRKILAKQPDSSVTIISIGFSTNIARLLLTGADQYSDLTGRELVARKVKLFSLMAGDFTTATPEYNVKCDIPAMQLLFALSPVRIVTSPFDVGLKVVYPAVSIEHDFTWAHRHPLTEAFYHHQEKPYDRPTWDLTAVIHALEPGKFMTESEKGIITVDNGGTTTFKPQTDGLHSYLTMSPQQAENVLHHYLDVIPAKPRKWRR